MASKRAAKKPPATEAKAYDPDVINIPGRAAMWKLQKDVGGKWESCRWYLNGQAIDRWQRSEDSTISIEMIATRWGRGTYQICWLGEGSQSRGMSRIITIDDPKYPILANTYPNRPASSATAPENDTRDAHPDDRMSKIKRIASGKLGEGETMLMLFEMLSEDGKERLNQADSRAQLEIQRMRERARIEADEDRRRHDQRLAEEEASFKRRLQAQEEAHRFELERIRAQQSTSPSQEVMELRTRLAVMEASSQENSASDRLLDFLDRIEPHIPTAAKFLWEQAGAAAAAKKASGQGTS